MLVLKKSKIYIVKNILITGISGQDGLFLASNYLLKKNFRIYGVTREKNHRNIINNIKAISKLNFSNLFLENIDLENKSQVVQFIKKIKPSIIINLSGPSSVTKSLVDSSIKDSILKIYKNLIDSVIEVNENIVFVQAGSSEMFQNSTERLSENSVMDPKTPYAKAKYEIYEELIDLRKEKGLKVVNTILFNHESEYRDQDYLFPKIINSAINISKKNQKTLTLGGLDIVRDWSFAGDIVNAIETILEKEVYGEFVVGSGVGTSIVDVVDYVFNYFGLDYQNYVKINQNLLRDDSPQSIISNPTKIESLGWSPSYSLEMLLERCIMYQIKSATTK